MRALYTLLLALLLLACLPLLPLMLLWPRLRKGFWMRLGLLPGDIRKAAFVGKGSLWVHAASLGEVNAVAPVLRILLERMPETPLIFTHTTLAGLERSAKLFPQAQARTLLPFDLPLLLSPLLRRFKPVAAVIT